MSIKKLILCSSNCGEDTLSMCYPMAVEAAALIEDMVEESNSNSRSKTLVSIGCRFPMAPHKAIDCGEGFDDVAF